MSRNNIQQKRFKSYQSSMSVLPVITGLQQRGKLEEEAPHKPNQFPKVYRRDLSVSSICSSKIKLTPLNNSKKQKKFSYSFKHLSDEDLFSMKNISKNNITVFQELLDTAHEDSSLSNFKKKSNPISLAFHRPKLAIDRPIFPCRCAVYNKRQNILQQLNSMWPQNLKKCSSPLKRVFALPKNYVKFPNKVVIVNIEETLYKDGCIQPFLVESMKKIQKHYQIVFVSEGSSEEFIKFIINEMIIFSGLYEKCQKKNNIVNYSLIYKDFEVNSICNDTLIITSINCPIEDIEDRRREDLIAYKHGLYTNILVNNSPVPKHKHVNNSPILAVPALMKHEFSISFKALAKLLTSNESSSFSEFLQNSQLESFKSSSIFDALLERNTRVDCKIFKRFEESKQSKVCKAHGYPAESTQFTVPSILFGVAKFSAFPSKNYPIALSCPPKD